jgi:hypothetical protein
MGEFTIYFFFKSGCLRIDLGKLKASIHNRDYVRTTEVINIVFNRCLGFSFIYWFFYLNISLNILIKHIGFFTILELNFISLNKVIPKFFRERTIVNLKSKITNLSLVVGVLD